jgi:hypothetical protein
LSVCFGTSVPRVVWAMAGCFRWPFKDGRAWDTKTCAIYGCAEDQSSPAGHGAASKDKASLMVKAVARTVAKAMRLEATQPKRCCLAPIARRARGDRARTRDVSTTRPRRRIRGASLGRVCVPTDRPVILCRAAGEGGSASFLDRTVANWRSRCAAGDTLTNATGICKASSKRLGFASDS